MIRVHPKVQRALAGGEAVVALESAVVTHGLPRPQNLELALSLEAVIESAGAVPATVGLVDGELVVGLSGAELEQLAARKAQKASLWNLAALAAQGLDAGTTVAATLHAAHKAGIEVFATGGIGGVHAAFDESADLAALARYRVITVCAGPKSILDLRATLERLESLGVPVLGYRTDRLPGFYIAATSHPVAARCDSPDAVVRLFAAQRALGLACALLVCKPVSSGLEAAAVEAWTVLARREAEVRGLKGKDVTPYLLSRLAELSGGRTVEVNARLLKENARLAADIALAKTATHALKIG